MQHGSRPALSRFALAAALALTGAAAAHAADGVLELDPSCAAVGCFLGDAPGYPIEITLAGSYKLTGNLDVRNTPLPNGTVAVAISAAAVTLDLAGFRIVGPAAAVRRSTSARNAQEGLVSGSDGLLVDNILDLGGERLVLRIADVATGRPYDFALPFRPSDPGDDPDAGRCRWFPDSRSLAVLERDADGS